MSPLARAYEACEALARSHYENFPVASRLLPASMKPHVAAVYAFARVADDIADEGSASPADRLEELRVWRDRIHRAAAGESLENVETVGHGSVERVEAAAGVSNKARDAMIELALGHSIRALDLPLSLFDDLLSAFGQDTMTTHYDSWADVLDYAAIRRTQWGARAPHRGYRNALDRSSDGVHGAPAHELLAGLRSRLARGRLCVPREEQVACGARGVRARNRASELSLEYDWGGRSVREICSRQDAGCATAWADGFEWNCGSPGRRRPFSNMSNGTVAVCSIVGRRSALATCRSRMARSCGVRAALSASQAWSPGGIGTCAATASSTGGMFCDALALRNAAAAEPGCRPGSALIYRLLSATLSPSVGVLPGRPLFIRRGR